MDLEELYYNSKKLTEQLKESLPERTIDRIDINPVATPFGVAFKLVDTKTNYISERDTFPYELLNYYNFADMPCREYFENRGYRTDFQNSVFIKNVD